MSNVFELEATLKLKREDYQKGLSQAKSEAQKFQREISNVEKDTQKLGKEFDKAADNVSDAFKDMSRSADRSGDDISGAFEDAASDTTSSFDDMSDSADSASDDIVSAFEGAADDSEGAFDTVASSAEEAADGVSDAFSNIDISTNIDVEASSAADAFEQVADAASESGESASVSIGGIGESASGLEPILGNVGGVFKDAFGGMADIISATGVIGAIGAIGGAVVNLATDFSEAAVSWEESCDTIAFATGAVGDQLEEYAIASQHAYGASRNMNDSQEDTAAIFGQAMTLYGGTADEIGDLTLKISEYAYATGTDGVRATNDLYAIQQLWGEQASDSGLLMDKLYQSTQDAGISADTLTGILRDSHSTFESFGMTLDESIGFIDGYVKAGGDADRITRGMATAQSKLISSGVTDIPGTFQLAIDTISQYDNVAEAMNATIGDTGLTVADVFGTGKIGQQLVDPFLGGKFATEEYTESIRDSGGAIEEVMTENTSNLDKWTKQIESSKAEIGTTVHDITDAIVGFALVGNDTYTQMEDLQKSFDQQVFESARKNGATVQEAAELAMAAARESSEEVSASAQDASNKTSSAMESAKSNTSTQMNQIAQKFAETASKWRTESQNIAGTKPTVSVETTQAESNINTFGSIFNQTMDNARRNSSIGVEVHGSLPQIDAVRDAVGGISYGISSFFHFARGYNEAMLLTSPTVFGVNGGVPMIGGDGSGGEIVSGERHLLDMMNSVVNANTSKIYSLLAQYLPSCAEGLNVTLDGKRITSYVSKDINRQVNQRRAV